MSTEYHEGQENNQEGNGGSIELRSGRRFHPLTPDPAEVEISDIAHSLARNCRYNGHVPGFYSVAEHSVLMSYAVPDFVDGSAQIEKMWCLLHDASEAYLPDMPRPVKSLLKGFDEAEERIHQCIAERFDLPYPIPEVVEWMDDVILADEARQLMKSGGEDWFLPEPGIGIEVYGWDYQFAQAQFLKRFHQLEMEMGR